MRALSRSHAERGSVKSCNINDDAFADAVAAKLVEFLKGV